MSKTFTIYRSSAGSGKTRTLAKEYLKLALRYKADYFKHILAVTFTNKATQEMKDRILVYLDDFIHGRAEDLAAELKSSLNLDDNTFIQHVEEVRAEILHHYSQFSISTIDAFFQKVIRSFTREAGLVGDYRLEVEHDEVLEEVIDNLIDELGSNKELTDWVVEFAKENLENDRAWDIRFSLIEFSKEIFREEFKAIEDNIVSRTSHRQYFTTLRKELWQVKNFFLSKISAPAAQAMEIIKAQPWTVSDISFGKNSGLISFFENYALEKNLKELKPPGERVRNYFSEAKNWPNKKSIHASSIIRLAQDKLIPLLNEIITCYDQYYPAALSVEVALRNMYVFGLIADISRKLKEYKDENNLMLLADAPKFLNGVIQDSDTPFIYEKVGSFYRNYLIDEFQDTSGLQWKNFLPLLVNSLDQGHPSLVVGDVKQAIYRWRGGDLKLLQQDVEQHIGKSRVQVNELTSNYRSASTIVAFNNALFRSAAAIVTSETGHTISGEAYEDVAQEVFKRNSGFVNIRFFKEEEDGPKWKEQALDQIPLYLEQLQHAGVALKDIAILVRRNDEGQQIVSHLITYKNSEKAKPSLRYDVVSNESLRLDGAASVNLLLGAMQYLSNPDDDISRAQLAFEFARLYDVDRPFTEVFAVTNQAVFESYLPQAFTREKMALKKLPLFELTETLIQIFRLGSQTGELAYLQAFQDLVLDFSSRERSDLGAFLEWWDANKHKKSIQVSGEVDAVQILTIHKSKGLQFKYVLIPFCFWNMDHDATNAPNLWVTSPQQPFGEAGHIPVRYSGALERTLFREYYEEERTRSYLDNLNLLYVALTRAESGLMVTLPHPEVKNARKSVAQLLHHAIRNAEPLAEHWNEDRQEWYSGVMEVVAEGDRKSSTTPVGLSVYPSSVWRDKLVIRQSGKGFFAEGKTAQQDKINYGIHMHTVLSRLKFAEDIEPALDQLLTEGRITEAEKNPLRDQLLELLAHPQVSSWFERSWEVRTEVSVLLPRGTEARIDRLMLRGKKAVVVDFKTGDPVKADQHQVTEYLDVLRKMNFTDLEGYVLYVRSGNVVSVTTQKSRTIKKKDDNQLELGI